MEHGVTWFAFLPGYAAMQAALQARTSSLLGSPVSIEHVLSGTLAALIATLLAWRTRASLARSGLNAVVPPPNICVRNIIELICENLYDLMAQMLGRHGTRYFSVIGALIMFVFCGNALGLVPGFAPPTDNWNTTFACGIFIFLYYNFHGFRTQGLGHLAHMANPVNLWWGWFLAPIMLPIELISHLTRPLTLGMRLAANMVADHAVTQSFLGLAPIIVPLPFMALGLGVCVIQTFVFALLSIVYLSIATVHDGEGEGQGHDEAVAAA